MQKRTVNTIFKRTGHFVYDRKKPHQVGYTIYTQLLIN